MEQLMTRGRVHRALAAAVMLALVPAISCTTKEAATRSEQNDSANGPSTRLRFKTVRSIFEDSKGNYWFGSWNEGVARFDGDSLTYFTMEDGLSHHQITSIQEDKNGVVWFQGGVGISGFDGEKIITPTSRNYTSGHDRQLSPGGLWFKGDALSRPTGAEAQPGVYRYDGEAFTYLAYPLPQGTPYVTTDIAGGRSGRVWFSTTDAVFGYNGHSFTVIDNESVGLNESTGRLHVRAVFEDSKGRLWIGNNGIGVILYDGHTFTQFTQEKGLGFLGPHGGRTVPQPGDVTDGSPTLHRVFSIGEDRTGNIWFGTVESGAWRYDGRSLRNYTAEDGLTSKDIIAIYTDRHGDLWLAGDGVFKFNGASFDRIL
jgi:ligand-binding sensor domain-containing protein